MTSKLTNQLLSKAARIAAEAQAVQQELTAAFTERYGKTYSEVDCDNIIDVLDYHGGKITLSQCDEWMADAGAPRLDK